MNRTNITSWHAADIVVLLLALWMLSGIVMSTGEKDAVVDVTQSRPAMTVETSIAQPELMVRNVDLQGQVEPARHILIKAQTSGEVEQILTHKGARVIASETLVKLEESDRQNTLAQALAAVKSARSEQSAAQELQRQRLQSQLQLEQADAALEATLAQLAAVELDIARTTIDAPFAGLIEALPIEFGTLIERGDVVAELIDDSTFKVSARVSQHQRSQLAVEQPASVKLITGETLPGVISFIGSVADSQTRSFVVEALIANTSGVAAAGVSATLSIPVEEVEATFINPSALTLGASGELGVKTLDSEERVVFQPVELLRTALEGAWVTGIVAQARIITLGQGFVNTGEKVASRPAEPDT